MTGDANAEQEKVQRFRDAALPYLDDVLSWARYLMRDTADAEDAVQECYLRALRYFDSYRGPAIKPWLFEILRNVCSAEFARRDKHDLSANGPGDNVAMDTAGNTQIDGPDVTLTVEAAQALAMVIHELTTNAAKYGAISVKSGCVAVRWSLKANAHEERPLCIEWEEIGGPRVVPPTRSGLGTSLICQSISYELGGYVDHVFRSEGVRCKLEIPGIWLKSAAGGSGGPSREVS